MTFRIALLLASLLAIPAAAQPPDPYPHDDVLRLNHAQAIGTHNSYHLRSPLYPKGPPHDFDYEHAPLDVQLGEQGVRKFELDVYWDQDLGVFRVHHENFFDQNPSCSTLVLCLEILRDWSLAHREHHPVFVMIEPKGIYYPSTLSDEPICDPPEHTVCHYDDLDAEIRSVLAPPAGVNLLITPDEVRGARTTLREAVLQDGWPTLRTTRGRFLVAMLDSDFDRDGYTAEHPTLEGRAMFVNSTPDLDFAAVMMRDDPIGNLAWIQDRVAEGYVIRTRADALDDAQANDTTRRDAAFASGANYISTDYPVPEYLDNGYFAQVPGGTPSRCNPVSAMGLECTSPDIEDGVAVPEPAALALGFTAIAAIVSLGRRRLRDRLAMSA
jgi:hypothetical protein